MLRSVDWQVVGNVLMDGGVFETSVATHQYTRRNTPEASYIQQNWRSNPKPRILHVGRQTHRQNWLPAISSTQLQFRVTWS